MSNSRPFWIKQRINVPLSYQQQYPTRSKLNRDIEESRYLGYDPQTFKDISVLKNNLSRVKEEDLNEAIKEYEASKLWTIERQSSKKSKKKPKKKKKIKKRKRIVKKKVKKNKKKRKKKRKK